MGKGKVSDAADYRVASLHELPAAVPGLFEARPSAATANGAPAENGASAAAADAGRRNGLQRLTTGASLDEADLSIQEAMEVSHKNCFSNRYCDRN